MLPETRCFKDNLKSKQPEEQIKDVESLEEIKKILHKSRFKRG